MQYKPICKPNQIICGTGNTVIVTGWTVKETVAKHLKPDEYAGIGSCYSSTRGISPLLRNLLANPQVYYLVIINATKEDKNSGAVECLLDFFRHGFNAGKTDTGRDCWLINSPITGYIDKEITAEALELLRSVIQWQEAKSITEAVSLVKSLTQQKNQQKRDILIFPQLEQYPNVLPGRRYGHIVEGKTIAETWVKILHIIKTTGTIRPTGYDGKWQELIDLMAVVTAEPQEFYFPQPNYLPISPEFIKVYIGQILDDVTTPQEGIKYTYGQRLRSWFGKDQIEQVITKLIKEIDAASAVMSLWDVLDHEKGGSPCLNHIWVRIVDNELSLTAILRSNDMFAAWPANAMGLRALQQHIRDEISYRSYYNLIMGPLITVSQSAHIYEDTWENVDKLIANQYEAIINHRDYYDPCGNFLIEIEDNTIVVKQTTPGSGSVVASYSGKNPLKLIREICAASPAIKPDHIGYLGIELAKAAFSLKHGQQYTQDA